MKSKLNFLLNHQKLILQIALGLLFIALGVFFLKHERAELSKVKIALHQAKVTWIFWGTFLVFLFVIIQGMMYKASFKAIHQKISLSTGCVLYLKRNLVGTFVPAGMVSSLLFFNKEVEKREGVTKTQIYFASTLHVVSSILSSIILCIPVAFYMILKSSLSGKMLLGLLLTIAVLVLIGLAIYNILKEGWLYKALSRWLPGFIGIFDELKEQPFNHWRFYETIALSLIIEIIGIVHLYIAIGAMGIPPSVEVAMVGYVVVLLVLMSSPFLRGIGAVEVALSYVLTLYGFTIVDSISIAFIFRFFEFWALLALSFLAFIAQRDNLLVRIVPSLLLFALGVVNIFSALTPALPRRLSILKEVLPLAAINASVWLVLLSGLIMLAISYSLLRGLRSAWITAIILTSLSLMAHLTKGIDWEESTIAAITLSSLLYQRGQYFIKPDLKLARRSIFPGLLTIFTVILFGTIAFYRLDIRHFQANFTLWESFREALSTFLLIDVDLQPSTHFAHQFLAAMNLLGAMSIAYLTFLLLRPFIQRPGISHELEVQKAKALIEKYGHSPLDYFKTYFDKKYWFSTNEESFVSFKNTQNYALVLENPVAGNENTLKQTLEEFDNYCRQNGLRSAYYRIPESSKDIYLERGKKLLPIGEEATLNLETWNLQGKDRKAMRNTLNKMQKEGFVFKVNEPPQKDSFLQQLKAVSDDWLKDLKRTEIVFSQGLFDESELKNQVILSVENTEQKVMGFINLIPDYLPGEANFDLMRKTADAPGGTMDFLLINLFEYLKEKSFKTCNLGMVPLSGIEAPANVQEHVIKLAYKRMKQFGHFRNLRNYKEKFAPDWQMMYMAFNAPYDLLYLPAAFEKVIQAE